MVGRAAGGDARAWSELVQQYSGLVWSVARGYGLDTADAADVVQTSLLRLAENLACLRDPDRVGSWLATTARRESLRVLRRGQRQIPSGMDLADDITSEDGQPELPVLLRERDAAVSHAFQGLPALCRALLRVLMSDPAPSYAEVSEVLDMPVGSIGPRRARCLDRMRSAFESDDGPDRRMEVAR